MLTLSTKKRRHTSAATVSIEKVVNQVHCKKMANNNKLSPIFYNDNLTIDENVFKSSRKDTEMY